MSGFAYRNGVLHAEDVPLTEIAGSYGTPAYVYSRAAIETAWQAFHQPLQGCRHLLCYAVKANSNLAILALLARLGSGFDIVSGGELQRVLRAGGDPNRIVFSGVGKSEADIRAALAAGILCFNVESAAELERINRIALAGGLQAPVSLRVNPDVDARTHPYISTGLRDNKFGIDIVEAEALYRSHASHPGIRFIGADFHIGSQLLDIEPILDALDRVLALVDRLAEAGLSLHHIDVGGGIGVRYRDEQRPDTAEYVAAVRNRIGDRPLTLLMEPGRAIVAEAGVLITRVEYIKQGPERRFALVDAGMNDLLRPALYQAWQDIVPVVPREGEGRICDVVGPVCESADFLGRDRCLELAEGDLLAVRSAGAYGFVMASNYNTRPRPPEVLVDAGRSCLVRPRETLDDLLDGEQVLLEAL